MSSSPSRDLRASSPHTRRHFLLVLAGILVAVLVTWGGIWAFGTTTEPTADAASETLAATGDVRGTSTETSVPAPTGPAPTGPASVAPTSSSAGGARPEAQSASGSSAGAEAAPGHVHPGVVPSGPTPTGEPMSDDVSEAEAAIQEALPGTVLAVPRPGTRQETSLAQAASSSEVPVTVDGVPAAPDRAAGLTPRGAIDPGEVLGEGPSTLGGCLPEYGSNGQCLPVIPPSMAEHARDMARTGSDPAAMLHRWSCTEVRQLFPDGLPVRQAGVDPQGLDASKDDTACGADD